MTKTCKPSPSNKKKYIVEIGKILVNDNGKKKYYKPREVKKAHRKSSWFGTLDFSCWAMSIFTSHSDFDGYHLETGEVCNYVEMKTEMLNGISDSAITDWAEIPDLNIDSSWLDFGDVFDGLLEGIGELISGIFDGL